VGGEVVVITGTNLAGATEVLFGGTAASIIVNTALAVVVTTPAGSGHVDVSVITPNGSATAINGYTYLSPTDPIITSITPSFGPQAGGGAVVITGTHLTGATLVLFGGSAASILVNTGLAMTVTAPAGKGQVDVSVITTNGTATVTKGYTYVGPTDPTITSID